MRNITRILGVASAMLLITLLALGIRWHPDVGVSAASCSVSGVISTDTTWSPAACDPYIVTASVVVPSGVTLTIEAGTTVKFDSLKGLLVQGTLVARGTAQNPITFTSNQPTPAKGDWGDIHFTDSSADATFDGSGNYAAGSIVRYAIVEYAGSSGVNGALNIEASSPYIDHNTIRSNARSGISASGSGALRVTNNTIIGNSGGGIYVSGTATISNNTITGNPGRGISANGGTATISNNTITGNTGGGIYAGWGTATISNNTITGNTASSGGGIYASGTATISNNTITGNTASSSGGEGGGGIYASDGTATISNNTITGNTASSIGGGIVASGGTANISNNIITGNTASGGGGGIGTFLLLSGPNPPAASNTASSGGGIGTNAGTANITNNIITGNTARQANRGGGILLCCFTDSINDNDLYGNMSGSPAIPNDLYNTIPAGGSVDARNNYWGTTDPGVIEDHIWHFPDDSSVGLVDYTPFRTSSIGLTLTPSPTATPTAIPTPIPTPIASPTPTPTPTATPTIPNLSVTKITSKDKAFPGDAFTYLLFLENSGPTGITVALTDTIPTGALYISDTVWGGAVYSPTINAVFWLGTVQPGLSSLPSSVLSFRVRIDPDVSANAITNTVLVSDGSTTVASTARTDVWRRTMLPLLLSNSSDWSNGTPATPTLTPTPTWTASPTATATAIVSNIINIEIMDNRFSPQNQSVSVGSTVVWTNNGNLPHTTTSDTGLWDSGTLLRGQTFSRTFDTPGAYPYNCVFHRGAGMVGTITVIAPTSPTPTATAIVSNFGSEGVRPLARGGYVGLASTRPEAPARPGVGEELAPPLATLKPAAFRAFDALGTLSTGPFKD